MSSSTNTTTTSNPKSGQPGYVEQATSLLSSAAATVSSYLPASVTGVDPNQATDTRGAYGVGGHPGAHGGVGDLGTDATQDVARLPDERADSGPLQGAAGAAYASGAVGFGGPSSADNTDTFAAPNVSSSTGTGAGAAGGYSGKGLEPGQFDGLDKVRSETSGTAVDSAQYGSAEQTISQTKDTDDSQTSAPSQA